MDVGLCLRVDAAAAAAVSGQSDAASIFSARPNELLITNTQDCQYFQSLLRRMALNSLATWAVDYCASIQNVECMWYSRCAVCYFRLLRRFHQCILCFLFPFFSLRSPLKWMCWCRAPSGFFVKLVSLIISASSPCECGRLTVSSFADCAGLEWRHSGLIICALSSADIISSDRSLLWLAAVARRAGVNFAFQTAPSSANPKWRSNMTSVYSLI